MNTFEIANNAVSQVERIRYSHSIEFGRGYAGQVIRAVWFWTEHRLRNARSMTVQHLYSPECGAEMALIRSTAWQIAKDRGYSDATFAVPDAITVIKGQRRNGRSI